MVIIQVSNALIHIGAGKVRLSVLRTSIRPEKQMRIAPTAISILLVINPSADGVLVIRSELNIDSGPRGKPLLEDIINPPSSVWGVTTFHTRQVAILFFNVGRSVVLSSPPPVILSPMELSSVFSIKSKPYVRL